MRDFVVTEAEQAAKFSVVLPHLDERQRRLVLGAEARMLGRGGGRVVSRAARVREATVLRGVSELESDARPLGRVRRPGGGRKRGGRDRSRAGAGRCPAAGVDSSDTMIPSAETRRPSLSDHRPAHKISGSCALPVAIR